LRIVVAALAAATSVALHAVEIVIRQGVDDPTRIAVAPFAGPVPGRGPESAAYVQIADIVSFDLMRSGQFYALSRDNMLSHPSTPEEVHFRDWRILAADYLLIGSTRQAASGDLMVVYHLFDVSAEQEIYSSFLTVPGTAVRDAAHRISDAVYEQITGIRGAFSTKSLDLRV